ncbi:hypothetical protein [Paraburkholderia humisilvae]|uniref:Uncharacterized protein n=1 Tax=Paraburkholderia humisilvae TaxID=627669 RepID=A0A6J5DAG0_9BURK|nr:hypothetical protein [Paraburkholderia humisilvae]CAB3749915.1 hypothetical protein LMG29542_01143 [Paraburkholderia humisilvae]
MPRIPVTTTHTTPPPTRPTEVHGEPPSQDNGRRTAQALRPGEPLSPGQTGLAARVSAPAQRETRARPASAGRAAGWPDRYALAQLPREYVSTGTPGLFRDVDSGQVLIFHDARAYAVARDPRGTWRLAFPGDPSQLGQAIRRNVNCEWVIHDDVRLPGSPSAPARTSIAQASQRAGPSARSDAQVQDVESMTSDVDAARRAWSAIAVTDVPAATASEVPLTPREQAFMGRWGRALSASQFAELTGLPRSRIDACLRGVEVAPAAATIGTAGAGTSTGTSSVSTSSAAAMRSIKGLTTAVQKRVFGLLRADREMTYREIAKRNRIARARVAELARANDLERPDGLSSAARTALIGEFIRSPDAERGGLAAKYKEPSSLVGSLQQELAIIRRDWDQSRRADIAESRPELQATLTDAAKRFIRQCGERMSVGNLSAAMNRSEASIDAYRHSDDYRWFASGFAARRGSSARPAGTDGQVIPAIDRVAEFLLRFPRRNVADVARALDVTPDQVNRTTSNVQSALRAWREVRCGLQIRPSVIVTPLTEREKQYISKWHSEFSTASLATMMQVPKDVIDAFVHGSQPSAPQPPADSLAPDSSRVRVALGEWLHARNADIAGGRALPRVEYGHVTRRFVARWAGRLSLHVLSILVTLPESVIDAHVRSSSPASGSAPAAPPPRAGGAPH